MSQHRPVPRLDLAPKLRRPLSLWNPLDYLRLLYWVFYFPQALRWYVDTFGGGYIPPMQMDDLKGWKLLLQNSIQRQLLFQGLVLTVITPLALGVILPSTGIFLNWLGLLLGLFLGLFLNVLLSVTLGVAVGVALGLTVGVASGLAWGLDWGAASSVAWGVVFGVACSVAWGLASGVELNLAFKVKDEPAPDVMFVMLCMAFLAFALHIIKIAPLIIVVPAHFLAFVFTLFLVAHRPENWLFSLLLSMLGSWNRYRLLSHVTPLHQPTLFLRLTSWLRQDWESGIHNANQLLAYTFQFIPVIFAINRVLADIPSEQVLYQVAQLAEFPYDWKLLRFASEKLSTRTERDVVNLSLDTPARAAAAGFWHLHEKEPAKATEAFAVVRPLLYGEEMFALAQTLAAFHEAKQLATIAALQISASPSEPLLRPATWEAIASLRRVVEDVQLVQGSVSRSAKAFALARAQGELTKILNNADTLPQAERELILDIAQTWQKALLQVASAVGEISITKLVTNPYVVGDPVQGNLFVGREDVLRQLEELWVIGHQLQSIVLYGHRRMGKTSILLNAAKCSGSEVKVAYINLLRMGDSPQGVGEVLIAITDAISDTVDCIHPSDADLLNLPYRTFERYLKQVEAHLSGGLIIALDEFEKIEELIEAEKIPKDFMGYLRGLVQMSSKVAFAFAGLHTLEEMTADYFQPFFASVIPIHVGFLQPGATRQILANPDEDFPLDYTPEALNQIYALTAGQPYLVQLVGFQLVRRYNDFVFEQGRPRDPVFTVEDVEAVIHDPEFFKRGRYYFNGVWGQAARGAFGQQAILKVLAPYPNGLSLDELRTQLDEIVRAQGVAPLQEETLQEALKTLTRHDVIREREGCWQIIVELFRRWVLQN
jgi:hypothetical protein